MEYENNLVVTSPAFENEGVIPEKYTGYGEGIDKKIQEVAWVSGCLA